MKMQTIESIRTCHFFTLPPPHIKFIFLSLCILALCSCSVFIPAPSLRATSTIAGKPLLHYLSLDQDFISLLAQRQMFERLQVENSGQSRKKNGVGESAQFLRPYSYRPEELQGSWRLTIKDSTDTESQVRLDVTETGNTKEGREGFKNIQYYWVSPSWEVRSSVSSYTGRSLDGELGAW